jgi:hypothetical protein
MLDNIGSTKKNNSAELSVLIVKINVIDIEIIFSEKNTER